MKRFVVAGWRRSVQMSSMCVVHGGSSQVRHATSGRGRSLAPDDPFGERATWEDPDQSQLSNFKKFDEAAFDTATSSEEVQRAHFGPSWARFTTVGRMASAAMSENKLSAVPKSAEELHNMELQRKERVMRKNYTTYEEFAEHELAATTSTAEDEGADMYASTSGGRDIAREAVVGDVDSGYRLNQIERSSERLRETSAGSADTDRVGRRVDSEADHFDDSELDMPVPLPTFYSDQPHTINEAVADDVAPLREVADAQGEICTDTLVLPLVDPQQWTTGQVIMWIRAVGEADAMDAAMEQAFEIIRVDGSMLLQKVAPNTMFKAMRRWHMKRKMLVSKGMDDSEAIASLAEEFRKVVNVLMVQETIYLCYPYGKY
jgi:hypothetical protein